MKTKSFTLNSKELLLVELPNSPVVNIVPRNHKYKDFIMHFQDGDLFHFQPDGECDVLGKLPEGNWKLIGKLPEVTEQQYKNLVNSSIHTGLSAHYVSGINPPNTYCYHTAKKSFFSKLEAEGIYFNNPINEPEFMRGEYDGGYNEEWIREWQSAQEKVFNIENTVLFEKV